MSYNYFNSLFGNSSSADSGIYSIFSSSSNMLGDYAMIRSGVYKKLLNAYYKTQNADEGSSKTESTEDNVEKSKLVNVKTDANVLVEAADKLNSTELYKSTGKDEDGQPVYDREAIKSSVKSFVEAYNSYIDSASAVENTGILQKSLSVVKETAVNQKLLSQVGITIGKGNKLSVDEEKLDAAKVTTLTTLFTGRNSYALKVNQKAAETGRLAYSTVCQNSGACAYTYSGMYSSVGSTSNLLDKYL